MIRIALEAYEVNDPEKGNYFYLRGEVSDEGYAGWTEFVVAEEDLRAFFEELKDFAKEFKGSPELKAGWRNEVYFRVRFEKWKPTGSLWVGGEIAAPARSGRDLDPLCSHQFTFGFPTDPVQFDSFLESLLGLLNRTGEEAVLESFDQG
jgi:hypothetical protein